MRAQSLFIQLTTYNMKRETEKKFLKVPWIILKFPQISAQLYYNKSSFFVTFQILLPYPQQIINSSVTPASVLNQIQFWHCLPGDSIRSHGWGLGPQDTPTSVPAAKPRLFYLCFWQTDYELRSRISSLDSISCLSGSQSSANTHLSSFIVKDITNMQVRRHMEWRM
jgi:hypothetical protein